jgi:hypothetical protein
MIDSVEKTTIRKVYVRHLPLLFGVYFICYLDRIKCGQGLADTRRVYP